MSSKNGFVLYSSMNSTLFVSARGAGLYMISEMTRPVLREEGPGGSEGFGVAARTAPVASMKSRNFATADWLVLWLVTARPRYI